MSSSDEDDYIQVFFAQQFKEKIDPIKKQLTDKGLKLDTTMTGLAEVIKEVTRIDAHYDGVCKAIV